MNSRPPNPSQDTAHYDIHRRLSLFPLTVRYQTDEQGASLSVGGCDLENLAAQFGTPLYLYDQATMDSALAGYAEGLQASYPGDWGITYAGKAFLCTAMAQWVAARGLWVDCSSAAELQIAAAGSVPRAGRVLHGVNKSTLDLESGLALAGVIVVDGQAELERLAVLYAQAGSILNASVDNGGELPALWLRLRPGMAPNTHAYIQTGQLESKFGFDLVTAEQAVTFALAHDLPLTGVHFHLGSGWRKAGPLINALETVVAWVAHLQAHYGWQPQVFCPGGGLGVAYHEDELPHPDPAAFAAKLAQTLVQACDRQGLARPRLQLEPGRSLVARAGVALYRLGTVKRAGERRWLLLDGGMADNPRPALYGARYSALPVRDPERPVAGSFYVGGPYCESGDVLIQAIALPELQSGELLAVPVSGAYQLSMSSNYNGAPRLAVLWLSRGQAHLIQRRETAADLLHRDRSLPIDTGRLHLP